MPISGYYQKPFQGESKTQEIYQKVMEECTIQINRIKKEYGEALEATISDRISKQYSSRIENLEKQNEELVKRLERMEKELHDVKSKVERDNSSPKQKSTSAYQDTNSNGIKNSERIKLDYDFRIKAFEFNGWYYYVNEKMGKFLYRVRTDGTGNEQLTDYTVANINAFASVKNGRLYFKDAGYNEKSIEL